MNANSSCPPRLVPDLPLLRCVSSAGRCQAVVAVTLRAPGAAMLVLISRCAARARLRLARALRHPSRRLLACLVAMAVAGTLAAVAAVRRRHAQRRARASFASLFGDAAGDDAQAAACLAGRVACACEYICSEQGCLLSPGRFGAVGVPGTCVRASSTRLATPPPRI